MYSQSDYRYPTDNEWYTDDYDRGIGFQTGRVVQNKRNDNLQDYHLDFDQYSGSSRMPSSSVERDGFRINVREINSIGETSRSVSHYNRDQSMRSQNQSTRSSDQSIRPQDPSFRSQDPDWSLDQSILSSDQSFRFLDQSIRPPDEYSRYQNQSFRSHDQSSRSRSTDQSIRFSDQSSKSQNQSVKSSGQSSRARGQSVRSFDEYRYGYDMSYGNMSSTSNDHERIDNYRQREDVFDVKSQKNVDSYGSLQIKSNESYGNDWGSPAVMFDSQNSDNSSGVRMNKPDTIVEEPLIRKSNNHIEMDSRPLKYSKSGKPTKQRKDEMPDSRHRRSNQQKNVNTNFRGGGVGKRKARNKMKNANKRQAPANQSFSSKMQLQSMASLLSADTDRSSLKLKQTLELREKQLAMASDLLTKQTQLLQNMESNMQTKMTSAAPKMAPGIPLTGLPDSYQPTPLTNQFDSMPPRQFPESGPHDSRIDHQGQAGLGPSKKSMKRMRRKLRKKGVAPQDLSQQSTGMPVKRGIDQGGDMMVAPPAKKIYRWPCHNETLLSTTDQVGTKCSTCFFPIKDTNPVNTKLQMWLSRISAGCSPCGIVKFKSMDDCRSHFQTREHLLVMRYVKRDIMPKTKYNKVVITAEKFSKTKTFGEEYYVQKTGMYCTLCKKFYQMNEKKGKTHLNGEEHYNNWVKELKLRKFEELLKAEMDEKNKDKPGNDGDDNKTTAKSEESESKTLNEKSKPESEKTVVTQSGDTVDCKAEKENSSEDIPIETTEEKDMDSSAKNGDDGENCHPIVGNGDESLPKESMEITETIKEEADTKELCPQENCHPIVGNGDESLPKESTEITETIQEEADTKDNSQAIDDSGKDQAVICNDQAPFSEEIKTSACPEENAQETKKEEVSDETANTP